MAIDNERGGYAFVPGGEPYSAGVVADAAHEIVHLTLRRLLPWREGFDFIDAHLRSMGRPRQALCAVELRCSRPYPRTGFVEFNAGYRSLLREWDLLVDGENPIARTNVAPIIAPPPEQSMHGFSYTVMRTDQAPSFVVSGAGELMKGPMLEAPVVRPGESDPAAMREKAGYVMHALGKRLEGLGVSWDDVTCTEVYTALEFRSFAEEMLLAPLGAAARHGLVWHPSLPPIDELLFEMDARGVSRELAA